MNEEKQNITTTAAQTEQQKPKSEIKQTNFRIGTDAADKFRQYCEANGLNQAQGFDHLIEILDMDQAKTALPDQAADIELFKTQAQDLINSYLHALSVSANFQKLATEHHWADLASKDKTIADLQARLEASEAAQKVSESTVAAALQSAAQADKDATQAREQAETAQKLADEKDKTIATLADKLATAEAKADGYDALKEQAQAAETALKEEQKAHAADVKALQAEMDQRVKDTEKDAEIARLTAQNEADKQISAAQDKAKELEQRLKDAEKDAEIARLKAQSEADKQIADLQARVERLTAELAAAQKGHKAQNKPESGAEDSEKGDDM